MSGDTEFGFQWGNTEVVRYAVMPNGTRVVGIEVNDKRVLDIYVSPSGRSVRVFRRGKGELLPVPVPTQEKP
jgi:hypothetical protein